MAKRFKAAVIGGSGYGGGELIRRLLLHPEVELARVASIDLVGEPLSAAHPNLEGRSSLVFEGLTPAEAARDMDVVLLGLPHKVAATKMPELLASGAKIVDLSGDFRLRDPAVYKRYYHAEHPCPDKLAGTDPIDHAQVAAMLARPAGAQRRTAGALHQRPSLHCSLLG